MHVNTAQTLVARQTTDHTRPRLALRINERDSFKHSILERKVMSKLSRGTISFNRLFATRDLGVRSSETHVDKVIEIFLSIGESVAARWIQMPKGILLLQMVPGDRASGAIYLYDRVGEDFYLLSFEAADENLTVQEFAQLLQEYNLLQYAQWPELCGSSAAA
jgi:hypothetical protein